MEKKAIDMSIDNDKQSKGNENTATTVRTTSRGTATKWEVTTLATLHVIRALYTMYLSGYSSELKGWIHKATELFQKMFKAGAGTSGKDAYRYSFVPEHEGEQTVNLYGKCDNSGWSCQLWDPEIHGYTDQNKLFTNSVPDQLDANLRKFTLEWKIDKDGRELMLDLLVELSLKKNSDPDIKSLLDELIGEFYKTKKEPSDHLTALAVTSASYSSEVALSVLRMFLIYMKKTVLKTVRGMKNAQKIISHVEGIEGKSLVETARLIRNMEMLKRIIGNAGDVSTDMIRSYIAEATVLKLYPMRSRDKKRNYDTEIVEIYGRVSDENTPKMLAEILKPTEKPK